MTFRKIINLAAGDVNFPATHQKMHARVARRDDKERKEPAPRRSEA